MSAPIRAHISKEGLRATSQARDGFSHLAWPDL